MLNLKMSGKTKKLSVQNAQAWQPVIRELIKHENDLVNQRLGWLIQMQALLFAALAFAWKSAPMALTILLSILGIATAISLGFALALYSPAIRGLKEWWSHHRPDGVIEGPDVIGLWAPSEGIEWYLRPWRALPVIFIIAWVGVLVLSWFYKT
jgi:ABC-type amino acid transport system permease subunit